MKKFILLLTTVLTLAFAAPMQKPKIKERQQNENTTQATQAFFAAPEEFVAEKPAVKQESKPVLEKFVKPEQDMAPAGSFLNPYRQKAIDFSGEGIP